ncbi:acyl-CoA dehydrogenase family member 11-like isoform X1 [Ptychodera flava]|uniref:acyl-CoA dehydrogenase family member 11-like isoform X1 n=1 Tax=Ptychodera flava TaxID=63121 RepID=UPI00396A893F
MFDMNRLHPLRHFSAATTMTRGSTVHAQEIGFTDLNKQGENGKTVFARAKRGQFFQTEPHLENQYLGDAPLRAYLKRNVPKKVLEQFAPDLERFGHRCATDIHQLGRECELNPPSVQHFDAWGNRVDDLITCSAWKSMHDIAAEEGLISIAYERKYGPWSRLYQIAKLYLYIPSSGLYSCPLAMTDGAAQTIDRIDKNTGHSLLHEKAFPRLISRDPQKFWTSGQWMTERKGGSDVAGGTETVAVPQEDGTFKLYGYKWFSSATDSNMTLALARIVDENKQTTPGSKGLSMFYMETRNEDGSLNGIDIQKLKNKLGTRQLPTAELLLDGSTAHLISEPGRGVAGISNMLTITRLHNATGAVSGMRRMVNLARDYSKRRTVFGKLICEHPLHMQTLARMEVETRAALFLVMEASRLLGLEECKMATEHDKLLLRIMTPLMKLYTAKQAMTIASEGLECFGGQGYIEDTGLPAMLRDAQVLPIWEGTTNVLSMDVLRAIAKTHGKVLQTLFKEIQEKVAIASKSSNVHIQNGCQATSQSVNKLAKFLEGEATRDSSLLEVGARDFAYSLARTYMASLLLEHAVWDEATELDAITVARWCEQDLCPVVTNHSRGHYDNKSVTMDTRLVMDGYTDKPLSKL